MSYLRQSQRVLLFISIFFLALIFISLFSLTHGIPNISLAKLISIFQGGGNTFDRTIVLQLRLPRLLLGILSGASLGIAGVLLQDTLKNDLAGPELIGVTAGAVTVIATITVFSLPVAFSLYPIFALFGSLVTSGTVIFSARNTRSPLQLALIGAAVSALLDAVMITIIILGSQTQITFLYQFLLGSLSARSWQHVQIILPWIIIGIPIAFFCFRFLNILRLGDTVAEELGLHILRTRIFLLIVSIVLVAPVVAVCGPIAFVSLISPHLVRRLLCTHDAKITIPFSGFLGILLLTSADVLARLVFSPQELPVGAWTTIIGGPIFLLLLRQKKRISSVWTGFIHTKRSFLSFPLIIVASCLVILLLGILHLGIGQVFLSPAEILATALGHASDSYHTIILFDLRLPRTLIAIVVGLMLGLAGAILQSVTRNQLAEPTVTGVSAGGVFFAAVWMTFFSQGSESDYILPFMALLGSLVIGGIVYLINWKKKINSLQLLLTGVVMSAILTSLTALLLLLHEKTLGSILIWVIGSLDGRAWTQWNIIWPWALVVLPIGFLSAKLANVLLLGDDVAKNLGLRVELTRGLLLCVAVILAAGAVAVAGAIGFISLIGPHIARKFVGNDARRLFPTSSLITAALLVGADIVAQAFAYLPLSKYNTHVALPVGAVTALLGAPFFLFLVRRKHI